MAQFEIRWEGPSFEYREKDVSWYWLSIILAVVMIGFAIWQKNFLFGFFIVIAEILILVWGNKEPIETSFVLNETGLTIGGKEHYAYKDFSSFSASDGNDLVDFILHLKSRLHPHLRMKLPKAKFIEIQKVLKPLIPQIEYELTFLDAIEHLIGF